MADLLGIAPSPGAIASMARRIADAAAPAVEAVRGALAAAPVAHFDETGFRVAGRLAWVHSASWEVRVVTVHAKRGRDGMDAAGVLPGFGGIACHDAWAPYDCYDCGGHALCCAHVLRELTAVTATGTDRDVTWARQAIEALLALKKAADAARADGWPRSARRPWTSTPAGSASRLRRNHAERRAPHRPAEEEARPGVPAGRPRGGLPPIRL